MPPRSRQYDDSAVRQALRAQWQRLVPAFEAADPAAPSRLPGWDVQRLACHVTGTVDRLVAALDRPAPATARLRLADYYVNDVPAPDPEQPTLAASVAAAVGRLASEAADRLVTVPEGDLRLLDYLLTRLVEAVVHGRDLPTPAEPDPGALRLTVRVLADLLAERHPGRSVEVRIPPHAAVQCLGGPVHTRGTPPNVVETDPLTWLDIACGRETFVTARQAGRISASGLRADLSGVLPVL